MCGFAGVVSWDESVCVTRETLTRMSARIAHRGPDGEGMFLRDSASGPRVGLVHRRLAILDPDPRADQPFSDAAGRRLVFNGEIYNFRDLRAELSSLRPEYRWRTDCDTEVLLLAYAVWGDGCVDRLRGMFAFAVWDEPAGRLFLARDRMGQKPLFFAHPRDGSAAIAFGSDVRAVRECDWALRDPDSSRLYTYLRWGYADEPGGVTFGGQRELAPGETLAISAGSVETRRRYFTPDDGPPPPAVSDDRAIAETRRLVTAATRSQLVSDVPIGCFLSGGIDSSVIAACMRAAVPRDQPVLTFSIGFDDPRYDETEYAAAVARHLGTEHHAFRVTPDAIADLPLLARAMGDPLADSSALPTHYLSRETREFVKVALSGDGGDELFGGYDRYRAMRLTARLDRLAPLSAVAASPAWQALPGTHPKSRLTRFKRLLAGAGLPAAERYASYLQLFDAPAASRLMGGYTPGIGDRNRIAEIYAGMNRDRDEVRSSLATDRRVYLPQDLLAKVDRCSMLHALEVRSPFMDHDVVNFAAGLTTAQLLSGGPKRMLREAFAPDLPAWVFRRKKMGFAVPVGPWFREELKDMLRDRLLAPDSFASRHLNLPEVRRLIDDHQHGRADHAQRLYALLLLELYSKDD